MIAFQCSECPSVGRFVQMDDHQQKTGHKYKRTPESGIGCDLCSAAFVGGETWCNKCGGTYCRKCFPQHPCEGEKQA